MTEKILTQPIDTLKKTAPQFTPFWSTLQIVLVVVALCLTVLKAIQMLSKEKNNSRSNGNSSNNNTESQIRRNSDIIKEIADVAGNVKLLDERIGNNWHQVEDFKKQYEKDQEELKRQNREDLAAIKDDYHNLQTLNGDLQKKIESLNLAVTTFINQRGPS
ncbi:hypothetical protein LCGC14_1687450 [marine sediment metagenome]|uniref:Uncharacterized protein n=1 Tax=marine sediment metagenome TaxID=412755 RepID=A0A0F9HM76_9ZZZZ